MVAEASGQLLETLTEEELVTQRLDPQGLGARTLKKAFRAPPKDSVPPLSDPWRSGPRWPGAAAKRHNEIQVHTSGRLLNSLCSAAEYLSG